METRTCGQCGETKLIDEFTRAKPSLRFSNQKQTHHSYCKKCNAARAREWRKARPGYVGSGAITAIPKEDRLLMSAIRQRLSDAKGRCKKLNKPMPELTAEYLYKLFIAQNRACALTGAPISLELEHPLCISLDQIDPTKGYKEGNVQWLGWVVNRAKGDLSLDHFYEMCEAVLEYRKVQRLSNGDSATVEPSRVGSSEPKHLESQENLGL